MYAIAQCHRSSCSQENLEVELERADGISANSVSIILQPQSVQNLRQLKLLQHAWMQNAKDTDGVVLATEVELDRRRMAGQESGIYAALTITRALR